MLQTICQPYGLAHQRAPMCFEFAPKYMFILQHQAPFYKKSYVHSPLVNGNRWYLVSQATIRGPLLLAPALHVVQVQVGQICIVGVLPFLEIACTPAIQFCKIWRLASSFVAFLAFLVVLCGFVSLLPASRGVFNI